VNTVGVDREVERVVKSCSYTGISYSFCSDTYEVSFSHKSPQYISLWSHGQPGRQTDGQTDDIMMTIADRLKTV